MYNKYGILNNNKYLPQYIKDKLYLTNYYNEINQNKYKNMLNKEDMNNIEEIINNDNSMTVMSNYKFH